MSDTLSTTSPEALELRMLADSLREHADAIVPVTGWPSSLAVVADDMRDASRALTELAGQI